MKNLFFIFLFLISGEAFAEITQHNLSQDYSIRSLTSINSDGTAGYSSESIDVSPYPVGAVQLVYGALVSSRVITIEASLDEGTSWDAIPSVSTVTASGTGSDILLLPNMTGGLLRITASATSGAANANSSIVPYFIGKRN